MFLTFLNEDKKKFFFPNQWFFFGASIIYIIEIMLSEKVTKI
jgi:hypothetical protein